MSIEIDKSFVLGIINVQNDFLPGGVLAVKGGDLVIPMILEVANKFPQEQRFTTGDGYPADHKGFSSSLPHCILGTKGIELHSEIAKIDTFTIWVNRGDSEMIACNPFHDGKGRKTNFAEIFLNLGFKNLVLCGLTGCVIDTALCGYDENFDIFVVEDATCTGGMNRVWGKQDYEHYKRFLARNGAKFIQSTDLVVE